DDLPDWMDRHHVDIVRTHATSLDGQSIGKYVDRTKFLKNLPEGYGISEMAMACDIAGQPHLTHWHPERVDNFGDVLLRPDLETLISDGTDPALGHCICDFTHNDGRPHSLCSRTLLKRMIGRLAELGLLAKTTFELEFFLFDESFDDIRRKQFRNLKPKTGSRLQNIYLLRNAYHATGFMTEVIKRMEWKGIRWENWNDEAGTGQYELNLVPSDPLSMADNVMRVKNILYEVAVDQGLAVTFMPKLGEGFATGMHMHHSLTTTSGEAAFFDPTAADNHSKVLRHWLGGLQQTLPAAISFLAPTINSYRRFRDFGAVPLTATWGEENKSTALRLVSRSSGLARIEHRAGAGDPSPYQAPAVVLADGMAGGERELEPGPAYEGLAWGTPDSVAKLPTTIMTAADALRADTLLPEYLGADFIDYWIGTRKAEWLAGHTGGGDPVSPQVSLWEFQRYFDLV
ncbi:MAG: glutamine synthetase, partial [Pseudomonadales bacterium]|nr:glutamine synthetase [Pseudomonadales bacterium]